MLFNCNSKVDMSACPLSLWSQQHPHPIVAPKAIPNEAAKAYDVADREMIDAEAFDHSQLFLADHEVMKNDVSHRNPSVANLNLTSTATPIVAPTATPLWPQHPHHATEEPRRLHELRSLCGPLLLRMR